MCTSQVVEGSGKLFLCVSCELILWLYSDDQIIILVQFWNIAYSCVLLLGYQCWSYPGQSDFVLLSQTAVAIQYDVYQIYYVFHTEHQSGVRVLRFRIKTSGLLELLKLPEQVCSVMSTEFVQISDFYLQDVEDFVLRLVVNKTIYAKIDHPTGMVSFQQTKDPSEVLNE